jgi:hypothetical protein
VSRGKLLKPSYSSMSMEIKITEHFSHPVLQCAFTLANERIVGVNLFQLSVCNIQLCDVSSDFRGQ